MRCDLQCSWLDTHLLILLPQISSILRFFIYKNLKLARSRAYALTVSSRRKPSEFWSQVGHPEHDMSSLAHVQGYIEEWTSPPVPPRGSQSADSHGRKEAKIISWLLWWPTQLFFRHCEHLTSQREDTTDMSDLLLPLSPNLPLIAPVLTSFLRSLTTAEYLHRPYFDIKGMDSNAVWRWVEERKWAYRG